MERYETYDDTGIEWLVRIPSHWRLDRLKWSVTRLINGSWGAEPNGVDDIHCVRVADFNRARFAVIEAPPTIRAIENKERVGRLLRQGDLLIEKSGGGQHQPVGCVVSFEHTFDAICSNFIGRIVIAPGMCSRYWTYLHASLYSMRLNVPAIKQTTGIQNLDTNAYFNQRVPFPPLTEQQAIANFLDRKTAEIDALIAQKERLLELYEEEKSVIINHAVTKGLDPNAELKDSGVEWLGEIPVGWEIKKLKYGVSKVGSGVTPSGGASIYQLSGIPLLRSQNIHVDGIKMDDVAYIDEEIHDSMSNSKVQTGDVLLNITGASIGRCFYVEENFGEANVNQHVCIIRPNGKIKTSYLYFVLRSDLGEEQIKIEQTGSGREGLNFEALNNFIIPYLSVEEQTAIANFLDRKMTEIDTKIAKTQRIIELQKEYRTALISDVVTGKINVSHLAGEEAAR